MELRPQMESFNLGKEEGDDGEMVRVGHCWVERREVEAVRWPQITLIRWETGTSVHCSKTRVLDSCKAAEGKMNIQINGVITGLKI